MNNYERQYFRGQSKINKFGAIQKVEKKRNEILQNFPNTIKELYLKIREIQEESVKYKLQQEYPIQAIENQMINLYASKVSLQDDQANNMEFDYTKLSNLGDLLLIEEEFSSQQWLQRDLVKQRRKLTTCELFIEALDIRNMEKLNQIHLIFNKLPDFQRSFQNEKNRKQLGQGLNGKKDPNLNAGLLEKTLFNLQQEKYKALSNFFREGGTLDIFSVDLWFNGQEFLNSKPFNTVRSKTQRAFRYLDFSRDSLLETINYQPYITENLNQIQIEREVQETQLRNELMGENFKTIQNLHCFFQAIPTQIRDNIVHINFNGNSFSEKDTEAFCSFISKSKLEIIDISECLFDKKVFYQKFAKALGFCQQLRKINFGSILVHSQVRKKVCHFFTKIINIEEALSDETGADIFQALNSSKKTITHLYMNGPKNYNNKFDGQFGEKTLCAVSSLIFSIEQLQEIDLSGHKFKIAGIAKIISSLKFQAKILVANFYDINQVETEFIKSCCCKKKRYQYIPISNELLTKINYVLEQHLQNPVNEAKISVVKQMYTEFKKLSVQISDQIQQDINQSLKETKLRQQQELEQQKLNEKEEYERQLKLSEARSSKILYINQTNNNKTINNVSIENELLIQQNNIQIIME